MKGIFVFLLAHALPTWSQETSCYFSKEIEVVEDLITVSQETSLGQATVKVEVAYAGLGWVGFGFSESGEMAGSTGRYIVYIKVAKSEALTHNVRS